MLNIKLLALSFLNVTIYAQAPSACLSLISSVSSCSSKYSAFHATVTDEKEAIATAQACLCGNSQAFVSGVSACESHTKEAKAALATAIGMEMNMDVLPELGGLCDKSGAMMTAARASVAPQGTGAVSPTAASNGTVVVSATPSPFAGAGEATRGSAVTAFVVGLLAFFY